MKQIIAKYKSRHPNLRVFDLTQLAVVILFIAAIGAYKIGTSHASPSYTKVSGIVVDQKGHAVGGVGIWECQNKTTHNTASNGTYNFTVVTNTSGDSVEIPQFCLHPSTLPASYSNLVALKEPSGGPAYDYQVAGLNCFHNYNNCGPTKPYRTSDNVVNWDVSVGNDSSYNWRITYNDRVGPSAPSLKASVSGTSRVNLSWTASTDNYSGICGYDVYVNGGKKASTGGLSYSVTSLSAGATYTIYVQSRDCASPQNASKPSNIIKATTARPPSSGGGGGGTSGGGGGGSVSGGGGSTSSPPKKASSDKTSPSTPKGFDAKENNEHKSVELKWEASKDNVVVSDYQIEQSFDNKNWNVIANAVTDTSYEDFSPAFGQINYYRILAVDSSGNKSQYAYASSTASDFAANVIRNQASTISSEDGVVDMVFKPNNSLDQDLFCTITTPTDILGAAVGGYRQVQGPYQLLCRDSVSSEADPFSRADIETTIHTNKINGGKKIKLVYYGQDDSGVWQPLTKIKSDNKAKTETINLNGHKIFTIMTPIKKGSIWFTLFKILLVILAIAFAVIMALRFKFRKKLEDKYEDYVRQSRGF